MTIPVGPRRPGAATTTPSIAPTELSIPIGQRVIDLLDLAYRARRPVLLEGSTGIGKSQIVGEFARTNGLDLLVLDLSLLEPPDLVGLPILEGGRTRYASPAELPTLGRGVLMLEELNRAEIPVMQPALQLLSARRLHSYELPEGWTCVAAINPEDGDYHVTRLDPALRSRFLQLSVRADRESWLAWAASANVHPVILRVVREHEDAFEHAPPRSWSYASELLHALRPAELGDAELVRIALRGYLPTPWALLLCDALVGLAQTPDVDVEALLAPGGDALLARLVRDLQASRRIDAITMIAARTRRILASEALRARVESGPVTLELLERLLAPLPGDLRDQCLDSAVRSSAANALLVQLGHEPSVIMTSYAGSSLRRQVQEWVRDAKSHRVRLVINAVVRSLDAHSETDSVAPHLVALASDAGPLALDLIRFLRARGIAV